jgi:membrane protein
MGAALAYYMALSLAPTLVIMLAVAGFAFSAKAAQGGLIWQMQRMVGHEGARLIQTIVEGAHRSKHGIAATVLGLFTLFFGATAALNELRDDLNTVWQVPDDHTGSHARNAYNVIKDRLLSLGIVLAAGLYLLASLILNLWVSAADRFLNPSANPHHFLTQATEWLVSLVAITVLFALIFKLMPNVSLEWSDVTIGAIFTSLLFTAGKFCWGSISAGPALPTPMELQAHSSSCWCGCTTLPRSSYSALNSPGPTQPVRLQVPLSPPPMIRSSKSPVPSGILIIVILVGVVAVLYLAREILIPLAFAVTLSLILAPAVAWLVKLRLGRVPAALLVLAMAMAGTGAIDG